MTATQHDDAALARIGSQALSAGDHKRAREAFEALTARGGKDASAWLGLAYACRGAGDASAALTAVEMALSLEPQNIRAMILKADHLAACGEARQAASLYRGALRQVPPDAQVPPDLFNELRRAKTMSDRYAAEFESYLLNALTRRGLDGAPHSRRVTQAVDIMLGKRQAFMPQPQNLYFPELAPVQFFDRGQFEWLGAIEAATGAIRDELLAVLPDEAAFQPYVEAESGARHRDHAGLLGSRDWTAFYLVKNGEEAPENMARCPATMAALAAAPLARIPGNSPSILFSRLTPGAHIPAHTGRMNTRLICHLPLVVPEKCALRVGNETRQWTMGEALVFDDTIQHEAWNESAETRVVLIFDVWRPELSEHERALVAAMFEAIDGYGAAKSGAAKIGPQG